MKIKRIIGIRKTCFVRSGGRNLRYTVFTVVSNRKNKIGVGCGKSKDVSTAIFRSFENANKFIIKINISRKMIENIIKINIGRTKLIFTQSKNKNGLIVGGYARTILQSAGIDNFICKITGSKNKFNVIKATVVFIRKFFYD